MRATVAFTRACSTSSVISSSSKITTSLMFRTPRFRSSPSADNLANHDGRPRDRLQHAQLAALDALGNLDFALARQQWHCTHLAQVHADGVVRLLKCSRCQVQFNVVAFFGVLRVELLPGKLGLAFKQVYALRVDRCNEIVKVIRRMHVVRQQVIHLTIGEVALFLALIHQLLDIVFELVFYRQSASRLPALFRRWRSYFCCAGLCVDKPVPIYE